MSPNSANTHQIAVFLVEKIFCDSPVFNEGEYYWARIIVACGIRVLQREGHLEELKRFSHPVKEILCTQCSKYVCTARDCTDREI